MLRHIWKVSIERNNEDICFQHSYKSGKHTEMCKCLFDKVPVHTQHNAHQTHIGLNPEFLFNVPHLDCYVTELKISKPYTN